jgi:hypothetical protein
LFTTVFLALERFGALLGRGFARATHLTRCLRL